MYSSSYLSFYRYLEAVEGKGSRDPYDSAHQNSDKHGRYTRKGISPDEQIKHKLAPDFSRDDAMHYYWTVHWQPTARIVGPQHDVVQWCLTDVSIQSGIDGVKEYWLETSKTFPDYGLSVVWKNLNHKPSLAPALFLLDFLERRKQGYQDIYVGKRNRARRAKNINRELAVATHYAGWTGRRQRYLIKHLREGVLADLLISAPKPDPIDLDLTEEIQPIEPYVRREVERIEAPAEPYNPPSKKKNQSWLSRAKAAAIGVAAAAVSTATSVVDVAMPTIEAVTAGAGLKDLIVFGVTTLLALKQEGKGSER